MNQKNTTNIAVVLTGGGTAGHITPLLAVARKLLDRNDVTVTLFYIGQKNDRNAALIEASGLPIQTYLISAGKYRRYNDENFFQKLIDLKTHALNMRDVWRVVHGYFQARSILRKLRPNLIFAKGGFVVVPVGRAAHSLHIPYITHDSDTIPGLANRLIAKGASKHAVVNGDVSFYPPNKTVVTGIPLNEEYTKRSGVDQGDYKVKLGYPENSLILFVICGTQGARKIDEAMGVAAPSLLKTFPNLQIIHVVGRLNEAALETQYASLPGELRKRVGVLPFVDNAYDYLAAADVVVGRAGATSLAECATIGRASVIVPAEQLTGGHQYKNALTYEKQGAIKLVRENELPTGLEESVNLLLSDPQLRKKMEEKSRQTVIIDAAERISDVIVKEAA